MARVSLPYLVGFLSLLIRCCDSTTTRSGLKQYRRTRPVSCFILCMLRCKEHARNTQKSTMHLKEFSTACVCNSRSLKVPGEFSRVFVFVWCFSNVRAYGRSYVDNSSFATWSADEKPSKSLPLTSRTCHWPRSYRCRRHRPMQSHKGI